MPFSRVLAGMFAKSWIKTFRGWIADRRKGHTRMSPVSSLPLWEFVRSRRHRYRYGPLTNSTLSFVSKNFSDSFNFSISLSGARSQASKTYLEKFHFQMDNLPLKDIILLALRALKEATSEPLTKDTCTIAVVGVEMPFRVLDEDELRSPLAELAADTR